MNVTVTEYNTGTVVAAADGIDTDTVVQGYAWKKCVRICGVKNASVALKKYMGDDGYRVTRATDTFAVAVAAEK